MKIALNEVNLLKLQQQLLTQEVSVLLLRLVNSQATLQLLGEKVEALPEPETPEKQP